MHAEEAKILAMTQSWSPQFALGFGGRGFLHYLIHLVKIHRAGVGNSPAAHCAKVRQQRFASWLDGADAASMFVMNLHQRFHKHFGGLLFSHVEMVAHHMKEGLVANKFACCKNGVRIALWLLLFNQENLLA